MSTFSAPHPAAPIVPIAPAITTREQLDALLENIAQLHRERDGLRAAQETELNAVRQKYRAPLHEIDHLIEIETSWAELWAHAHRDAFPAGQPLEGPHAAIGFRAEPPRVERASRRWTWTRIATTLAGLAWGRRYLRIPAPEVDKDALVADLARLAPEELRAAGIRVVQGEKFFITPHPPNELDSILQQAA